MIPSAQDSVQHLRKFGRRKNQEKPSTSNVDTTQTNSKPQEVEESDYVPESCRSGSDSNSDFSPDTSQAIVYKCGDCPEELRGPATLARHLQTVHYSSKSEDFKDQTTSASFLHGGSPKTHLVRHGEARTSEKANAYSEANKIFHCIDCDDRFAHASELHQHRVHIHGAVNNPLVCHICAYSGNHGATFTRHVLGHTNRGCSLIT